MATTSHASTVLGTDFLLHLSSEGDSDHSIEQRRTATRRSLMASTQARESHERFAEALRSSTRVKASWLMGWA